MPAGGRIVEIGSFRGRSTIVLARAAPAEGVEIVAIDPHAGNDRGPQEIDGFEAEAEPRTTRSSWPTSTRPACADRVRHVRKFVNEAHGDVDRAASTCCTSTAPTASGPPATTSGGWGDRVVPGRHDADPRRVQLGRRDPAIAAELLLTGGGATPAAARSLAEYRREPLAGRARLANVGRQLAQLPWFARNVAIKALVVTRLGKLARLLGHDGEAWPY